MEQKAKKTHKHETFISNLITELLLALVHIFKVLFIFLNNKWRKKKTKWILKKEIYMPNQPPYPFIVSLCCTGCWSWQFNLSQWIWIMGSFVWAHKWSHRWCATGLDVHKFAFFMAMSASDKGSFPFYCNHILNHCSLCG